MTSRLAAAFLAFILLLLLQLPGTAAGQESGGKNPQNDPLNMWRQKNPGGHNSNDGGSKPSAPPPPVRAYEPPPPEVQRDMPRTELPMGADTALFARKEFIVNNGKDPRHLLTYFWKEPDASPGGVTKKYPLVIVLHNNTGDADAARVLLKKEYRKNFPAFIVVPVLPAGKIWSFPDEFPDVPTMAYWTTLVRGLQDAMEMIPDMLDNFPIDSRRIYVIGCAEGGFGAFGAALDYADIIAAAVPLNGGWAVKQSAALAKVPLFVMHGDQDATFPPEISHDIANYIRLNGGKASFISVPGLGHECSDPRLYNRTMWEWLFSQHRKSAKPGPRELSNGASQ